MRRTLGPALGILLAAWLALAGAAPARAAVPWIKDDLDTAFAEAKVKNRPLLIDFYTSWCSYCLELDEKVFSNDEVASATDAFVPLRLNCDHGACNPLWKKYKLNSLPTVLALTPKGEVLGRLSMYRPVPDFLRFLKECLDPGETLSAVDSRIEHGERPPDLLLRSAEQHFEANDPETAARRYEQAIAAVPKGQMGISPDAHIGLARIEANRGDEKKALEHYALVLRSYPDSSRLAEAFVASLVILRDQGREKDIDTLFRDFAGRFPDDPAVLNDHAKRILETTGDADHALTKAAKAASLSPDMADYHATAARALFLLKRPFEALEAVNAAIRLRPTSKDYRLLRLEILDAIREDTGARARSAAESPMTTPHADSGTPSSPPEAGSQAPAKPPPDPTNPPTPAPREGSAPPPRARR